MYTLGESCIIFCCLVDTFKLCGSFSASSLSGKTSCTFDLVGSQSSTCGQCYAKQKSEGALFWFIVGLLAGEWKE